MKAVITGCNRGLGEGIGDILLENNWEVIGINRHASKFEDIICDVSNWEEVDTKLNELDNVNLLVLNAGIRRFNTVENMNIKDWEDSVKTNLNGVFYVTKKLISSVKKTGGDVVIIGSHSEKYTFENGSAYCSTKGGLKEFAECLMQEVRYDGVRVTYMSLGSIKNRDHGGDEEWKLTPKEVGESVLSIVSLPKKVLIPYIDVRPSKPLKDTRPGIEKLQYV